MCATEIALNAALYYEALVYRAVETRRKQQLDASLPVATSPSARSMRLSFAIMPDYISSDVNTAASYRQSVQLSYSAMSMDN